MHGQGAEVFIVEDDIFAGELLASLFDADGYRVTHFQDGETFAAVAKKRTPACLLLDVYLPGRSGLEILKEINPTNYDAPIILVSGSATVAMAVDAVRNGAFDVVEKPYDLETIVPHVRALIEEWKIRRHEAQSLQFAGMERLTQRERVVLAEVVAAASSKEAGRHLGLSPRTIEAHRAHIMMKLGAKNTADLLGLVLGKRASGS